MVSSIAPPSDDACYLALKAHDARFDGHFFTGVTSTGVYCRPVCRVRTPKRENCKFFLLATQAESAGFRPCMRCRPELAPANASLALTPAWSSQDASGILARQAAQLLDAPHQWSEGPVSMALLADRLGVSERHVRRIFEAHWGVSPLQYLQTRRLLTAKQLLTDTRLPVAQVAFLSGFASVRRFNAAFVEHYRLQPRDLRKSEVALDPSALHARLSLRASYRPPYDISAMLDFLNRRTVTGVEMTGLDTAHYARTLEWTHEGQTLRGWTAMRFVPERMHVAFEISETLAPVLPALLFRLRALLDLDADPHAIETVLGNNFPDRAGLRVPGTLDGFELGVRAILGQQITVQAARTLTTRLVQTLGTPIITPWPALSHTFPDANTLAGVSPEVLGQLGIVRQRQAAIQALARAVNEGLQLQPSAPVADTMAALQALPGIGPWTASYIAMRALRWTDAFPCGDVALHKALDVQTHKNPAQAAELASQAWRPWRSYAVIRAWSLL
jgi:AraC family transcriptional regulator of adaptative response / DNA-3-methyladenine glycosylase II